ncbi:MAG: HipA domain-containing protein [Pseudomonadales bacterium]|nr:HipA domain-containing protein [Pseudomonadales bacterium]
MALFDRAINNTDDHGRNFSLIHRGDGYRLSPAYDPGLRPGTEPDRRRVPRGGFRLRTRPPNPAKWRGSARSSA